MGKETVITAPTMAKALARVREELGIDALILSHEESRGSVSIKARSEVEFTKKTSMPKLKSVSKINNNEKTESLIENEKKENTLKKNEIPDWIRPFTPPSKMKSYQEDITTQTKSRSISIEKESILNQHQTDSTLQEQPHYTESHTSSYDNILQQTAVHNEESFPQHDQRVVIPVRRSDFKKFVDSGSSFDETITAISAICDLCEFHQLGDVFGDAWLREMNPEFTHTPIQLTPALNRVLSIDPYWLDNLSKKRGVILVGPPGSGKTVTVAKLAAMLLERGKRVRVVTLDTLKSSGIHQLEEYIRPLSLPIHVGIESLYDRMPDEIILIDTPALDINQANDSSYLDTLKAKLGIPFTLVLPADMNPIEANEIAHAYMERDTDTLIVTRLELTKRFGVPLRASHQGLTLVLTSKSPELAEGLQHVTPEILLERMLSTCEVSL